MKIPIEKIRNNPYRDLNNYPVNQKQVERLMVNIRSSGFWKNVEGRKAIHNGKEIVELAYGHHRIEAARQLGLTSIEIAISDLTEDQMIERMITENTTQRGHCMAALCDSVASIMKRLSYILLKYDTWKDFQDSDVMTFVTTCFPNEKSFDTNKGLVQTGKGLGHSVIRKYSSAIKEKEAHQAIGQLKGTGQVKEIIDKVTLQIRKEKKERKRKMRVEKNEQEIEKLEKEEKILVEVKKVWEDQPKPTIDLKAMTMFERPYQAEAFRKLVNQTNSRGLQIIPIGKQSELAQLTLDTYKKYNPERSKDDISEVFIQNFVSPILRTGKLNQYEIDREEEKVERVRNIHKRARDIISELNFNLKHMMTTIQELDEIIKKDCSTIITLTNITNIPQNLEAVAQGLLKLKVNFEQLTDQRRIEDDKQGD